ncbi:MAG TPA: DUF4301 family protein [Desulfatiglandales bacterium]|nr:DUF4301 family protein [Desulfatiglandales bacterium]
MSGTIFNKEDLDDIRARGMTPEKVLNQIEAFKRGVTPLTLIRPCTVGDGIISLENKDIERLCGVYEKAALTGRAIKFVPASGAASRMFELLMSYKGRLGKGLEDLEIHRPFIRFFEEVERFPFHEKLESAMSAGGMDIKKAVTERDYQAIIDYALGSKGLNLADLPKGLIPFHRYGGYSRTPVEEHIVEAAAYVTNSRGIASIHFTLSPEHEKTVKKHIKDIRKRYERPGLKYAFSFSTQKRSTDIVAVDMDNNPFRDQGGRLLFRPGGHGALLENLIGLNGDIVFIKNIDNVAPDRLKHAAYIYKKALGGLLVELQARIFEYLKRLSKGRMDASLINEVFEFVETRLSITPPDGISEATMGKKREYLVSGLNRPLRVCGMVKNTAEPGGGPFWIRHRDGTSSIQIVEASQVDMGIEGQKGIFESSTHFNPVDLVCGMRDYSGRHFNLNDYVDHESGQITIKSKDGKRLKALELPGLWNGSMAYWNSIFVEVPLITFSPVKTIFDLLRREHQPE